jgi:hypothetical protein
MAISEGLKCIGHTIIMFFPDLLYLHFQLGSCCEVSGNIYFIIITSIVANCEATARFNVVAHIQCEISPLILGENKKKR